MYGQIFVLFIQGVGTTKNISTVEGIHFMSWFPDEIVDEMGYYHAIIISGLTFALFQRCRLILDQMHSGILKVHVLSMSSSLSR